MIGSDSKHIISLKNGIDQCFLLSKDICQTNLINFSLFNTRLILIIIIVTKLMFMNPAGVAGGAVICGLASLATGVGWLAENLVQDA